MESENEEGPPACGRDWSELQGDVLMLIFLKLGVMEVLRAAGSVCRSWRKVAKEEPELWRRINMTNHGYVRNAHLLKDPTRLAIDRSAGRLEEFSVKHFGDDYLLWYLRDRTSILKKLCLISCYQLSEEAIADTAKRQPLLEEIQITFGSFSEKVTEIVGKECPLLKSFKFSTSWVNMGTYNPNDVEEISNDDEALGIAKTMHQLHHLQLIGNRLTNEGLKAILHGCPHLETLDIRRCYIGLLMGGPRLETLPDISNVNGTVKPDLAPFMCDKARTQPLINYIHMRFGLNSALRPLTLKTIRLPNDSVDDYEFQVYADREYYSDVKEYYDDVDYEIDDLHDENLFDYDDLFSDDEGDDYMF
ncbi:RNI-like superfamily protein [Rhynchospora pubera]|uniref:RNI-like superfamily protein n=1 Tax=Rhynchospora pubera TaxID=906938 RepID=A0AAV8CHA4_9POAL|nr:RNI-like superfamily protein [Rhynchospora pubera]